MFDIALIVIIALIVSVVAMLSIIGMLRKRITEPKKKLRKRIDKLEMEMEALKDRKEL
ncbi:hypothetical protein [Virgibacillus salexigens]|uniref:Uncharacterized protein n=1 Tax=Virgibacillus massiliensis TaxID=1462526 RepID=A0A024QDC1_9BACI|nr:MULTISPECIES: hypothetical protein [Virgibacillus]MYL42639.1 hypothetical protein [Virgibacillus massiliensis]CDQ40523.1 hypothetical protein BN990_02848 [Virgibacillus massiliensis]